MTEFQNLIDSAVSRRDMPYAVAMVADRSGIVWEGAAGNSSDGVAAGSNSLFRLFSMTKGIGSLAVLIMIDRGQLSIDTRVADILPDFAKLEVFESMGPDGPGTRPARTEATLRHLLTHTSGLAYEAFNEKMYLLQNSTGLRDYLVAGTISSLSTPLMFDPGDSWTYGTGLDWAGYMVQVIDGRSIDQFCKEEVLGPLKMNNTAFEPDEVGLIRFDGQPSSLDHATSSATRQYCAS